MPLDLTGDGFRRLLLVVFAIALLTSGVFATHQVLQVSAGQPAAPWAESREIPLVGLPEAQQQVSFKMPEPSWLPEGLVLKGSHVNPPNWANVFYGRTDGREGGLGIEVTQGATKSSCVFPDSAKQPVTVNGQPAVYVRGAWNSDRQWMDAEYAGTLEWVANGSAYHLSFSGLDLSREDLIRIAESVR